MKNLEDLKALETKKHGCLKSHTPIDRRIVGKDYVYMFYGKERSAKELSKMWICKPTLGQLQSRLNNAAQGIGGKLNTIEKCVCSNVRKKTKSVKEQIRDREFYKFLDVLDLFKIPKA